MDKQIIESAVGLNQSCLKIEEQEEVNNLLVKHGEALSLRDEIDTF